MPNKTEPPLMRKMIELVQGWWTCRCASTARCPARSRPGWRLRGPAAAELGHRRGRAAGIVLPLVKKYNVPVVAISNDDTGISEDPDVRFAVAKKIVERAADFGIPAHDIVVDPLVMPIGAMATAGQQVFTLVRRLREELGVNTTCGASNISFGLPNRHGINNAFLPMAMGAGMTSAIMNPVATRSSSSPLGQARAAFPSAPRPDRRAAAWASISIRSAAGAASARNARSRRPMASFPKHGVTVAADALSEWNAVEARYDEKRGLIDGPPPGLSGAGSGRRGDRRAPRKPGAQAGGAQGRLGPRRSPWTRPRGSYFVEVAEPDMHEPDGRSRTAGARCAGQWEIDRRHRPLRAQKLQPALRKGNWQVTVALHKRRTRWRRILDIWPGLHEGGLYGLAIDLGSTTIAAHLCDLSNRRGAGLVGADEPADPLRRRPDEPGLLRDDEPRRRCRDDRGRARGDQRRWRRDRAEAGSTRADRRDGLRLQPGDAPPAAGDRPGGTGPGALCAGHLGRLTLGARDSA
jgi:hypothetical protein